MLTTSLLLLGAAHAAEASFVYLPDAHAVSTVSMGVDVGARASGALRFVDPGVGRAGFVQRVEGGWAAQPWFAVGAVGMLSEANPEDAPLSGAGGAWVQVSRPGDEGAAVAGQLGAHREFNGGWALTATASLEGAVGLLRIGAAPEVEHRFTEGADALDLMLPVAVDTALGEQWRVGAEAIGQDLEAYLEDEAEEEAEGGATWLAAGTVSWHADHVQVALAPGVGIAPTGVGFAGRLEAAWTF